MSNLFGYHLLSLRDVTEHLNLESVAKIARRPGVQAVCRIIAHYFDGRACDSAATLLYSVSDGITLTVYYRNALGGKPLTHQIAPTRYEDFVKALRGINFDRMDDQPDIANYNAVDVWLVERAAGTFVHSVIVAPERAKDDHARLVNAVRNGLPEALRMVQ